MSGVGASDRWSAEANNASHRLVFAVSQVVAELRSPRSCLGWTGASQPPSAALARTVPAGVVPV
jgi:hypothetical protein